MNKKEKEENVIQIADTVTFEIKHILYQEINEHIFDRDLATESDDKRYGPIFEKVYNTVITRLNNFTFDD